MTNSIVISDINRPVGDCEGVSKAVLDIATEGCLDPVVYTIV